MTKFNIDFGRAVEDIVVADINIDEVVVGTDGNTYKYDVLVKEVKMADDKKSATVETHLPLQGDLTYEVTVKGYDMVSMVASDGDIVDVKVSIKDSVANQVNIGKKDVLQYALIDANKVDVTRGTVAEKNKVVFNIQYFGKNGTNYEMSYYANNAGLFEFNEVGDYAVITAVYNTGVFDTSKNEEIKITSEPTTFYAVAKAEVTVKKLTGYSTNAQGYFDYSSSNKDLVKMGNYPNLKFSLELVDGQNVDITTQKQAIYDKEGVYRGWIYVESVDEDVLDINEAASATLELQPRKAGTAVFMVYHQNYLADGYTVMSTPVAPITLTVKGEPELTTVGLNYQGRNSATVVISLDAADDDLDTAEVSVQLIDQYGFDRYDNAKFVSLTGNSQQAKDIMAKGGVTHTTDGKTITIDNEAFRNYIVEQNKKTNNDPTRISGQFAYTLTFQNQGGSWAYKTATIVVDVRGLNKDAKGNVTTNIGIEAGWFTPNIARINDGSNEAAKVGKFTVYEMCNGAKYDVVNLTPYDSSVVVGEAATGYYFKVYKDNVDVTDATAKLNGTDMAFNGTNQITMNFSKLKKIDGKDAVNYDDMGAGNYQVVVYKIDQSSYPTIAGVQQSVNVATVVATSAKTATCDAGAYTLLSRDSVNVTSNGADLDLLKCFSFKARNGATFNKYSDKNTADVADFGGELIPYYVEIDWGKSTPDSVYVKSVTFFEDVSYTNWWAPNTVVDAGHYAAYKVPVGYYVNINVAE